MLALRTSVLVKMLWSSQAEGIKLQAHQAIILWSQGQPPHLRGDRQWPPREEEVRCEPQATERTPTQSLAHGPAAVMLLQNSLRKQRSLNPQQNWQSMLGRRAVRHREPLRAVVVVMPARPHERLEEHSSPQ